MDESTPSAVNHHADHPGFSGVTGALCALVFLLTGRTSAHLAADLMRVGPGDHVVDIGCGPGTAVRTAITRGATAAGVDPSASMLRIARAVTGRKAAASWAEGSAESLPVPDDTAGVVWALATVHHWRDVHAGLTEIRRALRPGGRLLALERAAEPGATGLASHGWTAQQAEGFAALCRSAGFTDVAVTGARAGRRQVWAVTATLPA